MIENLGGDHSPPFLYVQTQVVFNRCFNLPLLDADVALRDGCAAVLKEVLNQGDIIAVVSVNLRGIVFAEAVGADAGEAQVVAHILQMLLDGTLCQRENNVRGGNGVVQAITADELIQGKGDSEHPCLPGFLFSDGQAVTISVPDNIAQPEFQNVGNADAQVSLQHERSCDPFIGLASAKALLHGLDDLFVLVSGESHSLYVHGWPPIYELKLVIIRTTAPMREKVLEINDFTVRISDVIRTEGGLRL